jgi:hypothetical protein
MPPRRRLAPRSGPRAAGAGAALAALALAATALSCGSSATGVRVSFDLDPGITLDQVRLQAVVDGALLLALDVPPTARQPITQGQDIVILVEDRLGGTTVRLLAAGLAAGAEVARGEAEVTVVAGTVRDTFITLRASAGCPAGAHQCDDGCYPDDDATHCGLSCQDCGAPTHGTATCTGNGCSFSCDPGFTRCGSECVDLQSDARNCNGCGKECQPNQLCFAGECVLNTCPDGQHPCSETCVVNKDPMTCGTRCEPCPVPAHGVATCDGTSCGISCSTGYHACGGACVASSDPATCGGRCTPCPTPPHGVATCDGTTCGYTCATGYHDCGTGCVPDTDPKTCGDRCSPCPPPPDHATATCDGTTCGYACASGYYDCGGWCQATGLLCDACPPCEAGEYCYLDAKVCYTPGVCAGDRECPSGSCKNNRCTCSVLPPVVGCRSHEQCLLQVCLPGQ